jgi:hypothetical protein
MEDSDIIKALECCLSNNYEDCKDCPTKDLSTDYLECRNKLRKITLDLINRLQAKNEALQMDNEQLKIDIANERMNLEKVQELYEERACLCEEQDRQLAELDMVLANYPYFVHFRYGTIAAQNHEEYEKLLAKFSKAAIEDFAEDLKEKADVCYLGDAKNKAYRITAKHLKELLERWNKNE